MLWGLPAVVPCGITPPTPPALLPEGLVSYRSSSNCVPADAPAGKLTVHENVVLGA